MNKLIHALAGALLVTVACGAQAQNWPAKPIRIVEPVGPGSAPDVFARQYGPMLSEALGQPVIIDNRAGANSAIGACEVAHAAPDGYTLLHGNVNNSLNDLIGKDNGCSLTKALVPVARLTATPLVMVIQPGVKANNLKEYIALAKAQPQLLTFASGGLGAITQLLGEKVKVTAGINVREIPYKAIGAELPDLLAGHVDTAYLSPVVVRQHIAAGKLRALGVASARRMNILPEVPTLAEAGLPGVEASGWNGIFVPAGTPRAVINRIAAETAKILASDVIKKDSIAQGYEVDAAGPDEYAAYVKAEITKWGQVIKDSHLKLEQ